MKVRNKIAFLAALLVATANLSLLGETTSITPQQEADVQDFVFDEFNEDIEIDPTQIRSIDDNFGDIELTMDQRWEVARIYFRSAFSDYRSGIAQDLQNNGNQLLLGGACIMAVIFASILRSKGYLCGKQNA